jgi:hypothetical protein
VRRIACSPANNRKKNRRRARGRAIPGRIIGLAAVLGAFQPVEALLEILHAKRHLVLSWLCMQDRAGRRIADMKKPGAVSRPGHTS